jgi:hypothetical protein
MDAPLLSLAGSVNRLHAAQRDQCKLQRNGCAVLQQQRMLLVIHRCHPIRLLVSSFDHTRRENCVRIHSKLHSAVTWHTAYTAEDWKHCVRIKFHVRPIQTQTLDVGIALGALAAAYHWPRM